MKNKLQNSNKIIFNWLFFCIDLVIFFPPANAQIISQPITPQDPTVLPTPQPLPETQPLPPLEDLLHAPGQIPLQPSLEQIPGTITVTQFDVIGSTVFSQTELAKTLEPFTKHPISFTELLKAQEAISQLYIKSGYITSGAFIPPQELKNGVVKIEVIEGEVESINITGLQRLKPGYLRSKLALATKAPLNQNRLLESLQMLQIDPLIANLSAELAAGSRAGISTLEINVREAQAFSTQLSIDNQRSPSVGTVRRQLQISHNNLLGFGDRFHVGYINTDSSNSVDDLSYSFPINPYNGTISLNYSLTNSNVIEKPFNALNIQSESRNYQITYRQPLKQTLTEDFSLGLTASR
ncbi:ShlB/FhaC/HecB family hemolysin secretion/activation protein [Aphanizomenon flos-aquae FACHB-1290]|nr:ShlB/FhaC/HecB family hemolysin secretion/activation protein [Aphanizomenon flos-aquae FACHB-1171]MBD2558066.1 ShlB/FhaC/HecB family hemolysin secretion/activation protein [Aphanizomenon flos-aquae FACHB-1290]MBD2656276.1 ShlB/FhaC/HecB family hemolysin secretion/activation protein [Aphanizomenon flos-aquae FACHB-1265]MBD2696077.1 ShlB/FhaC/HecB family hemolysin secretion/activation protein [Aphanizomenon flos-aquae FACHB-1287]